MFYPPISRRNSRILSAISEAYGSNIMLGMIDCVELPIEYRARKFCDTPSRQPVILFTFQFTGDQYFLYKRTGLDLEGPMWELPPLNATLVLLSRADRLSRAKLRVGRVSSAKVG